MVFDFSIVFSVFPHLLWATQITLSLTFWILLVGLGLGLPLGLIHASSGRIGRGLTGTYMLVLRGTPPLVQLFIVYFGLAQFEAVRTSFLWPVLRDAYWCTVVALGLNSAAYVAHMFSGALRALPPGQSEASRALGMSWFATLVSVRAPQSFRLMLPAYGNEVVMTVKATALASTVTVQDLMGRARAAVNDTYAPYEVLLSAAIIYVALTYIIGRVVALIERRMDPVRNGALAQTRTAPIAATGK